MKVNKKIVNHWLGNSYNEWIGELILNITNKKITINDIKKEMVLMYKDYLLENKLEKQKGKLWKKIYKLLNSTLKLLMTEN